MANSINSDSAEIWKPVLGWEGLYEVCLVTQRVRSMRRGRIMKPWAYPSGYVNVHLRRPGQSIHKYLHQIICEVAHGPRPEGKRCVRHLNGDARDNRPENLAWGTHKENGGDMVAHGTSCRGKRNARSVISAADALEIRRRCAGGETQGEVAAAFGITGGTAGQIARGERWSWLEGEPVLVPRAKEFANAKLSEAKVLEIRQRYADGETQTSIARDFDVTSSQISHLVRRKSWKNI